MPNKRKLTNDLIEIIDRRHYADHPERQAELEKARIHAKLAQEIYARRTKLKWTQAELAERAGTSVSAISRMESADYDGHSMNTFLRVMVALQRRVEFKTTPLKLQTA